MHHLDFLVRVGEGFVDIDDLLVQNRNHVSEVHILNLKSADMTGKPAIFLIFFLISQNGAVHLVYFLEKLLNLWEEAIMVIFLVEFNLEDSEDLLVLFLVVVDDSRVAPLFSILVEGMLGVVDMAR